MYYHFLNLIIFYTLNVMKTNAHDNQETSLRSSPVPLDVSDWLRGLENEIMYVQSLLHCCTHKTALTTQQNHQTRNIDNMEPICAGWREDSKDCSWDEKLVKRLYCWLFVWVWAVFSLNIHGATSNCNGLMALYRGPWVSTQAMCGLWKGTETCLHPQESKVELGMESAAVWSFISCIY